MGTRRSRRLSKHPGIGLGAFLLITSLLTSTATAFDTPRSLSEARLRSIERPIEVLRATEAAREDQSLLGRLQEKLLKIPLRPVRIGLPPRLPDDAETGLGVVLKLRF